MPMLTNLKSQLVCLGIAALVLVATWTSQTPVSAKVFGICWLSFILAIFATRPRSSASAPPTC